MSKLKICRLTNFLPKNLIIFIIMFFSNLFYTVDGMSLLVKHDICTLCDQIEMQAYLLQRNVYYTCVRRLGRSMHRKEKG